jgi:hypothetical protein
MTDRRLDRVTAATLNQGQLKLIDKGLPAYFGEFYTSVRIVALMLAIHLGFHELSYGASLLPGKLIKSAK